MNIFLPIVILLASIILTYIIRTFALKKSILDIPNDRSSHTVPTPRGGGLAFVIVWYIVLSLLFYQNLIESSLFYALLPGIILVVIGFIDDVISLSPKVRLLSQVLAAGLSLFFLGGFQKLDLGFFLIGNTYLLTAFALIFIVWMINLFNFLDGIDGYASTESILVLSFFAFATSNFIPLYLAIAVLGFLFYNWQKASIFMGDAGSTLLGFTIAVFSIYFQNNETFPFVTALIATSLFWFDATYTVVRRLINKEKISEAHRKHFFQRLVLSGFSHQKTVILLGIFINSILIIIAYFSQLYPEHLISLLLLSVIILFFLSNYVNKQFPFDKHST